MLNDLFLLFSYLVIGSGLKYIDQAYDKRLFSRHKANMVGILVGILGGYLIISDSISTMILVSIIIGNAILKKIDNAGFYISVISLIIFTALFGSFIGMEWNVFGFFIIFALLDQYGDDWREKRKISKMLNFFLHYGFIWKIGALAAAVLNWIPWIYFLAILVLDAAYSYVEVYSEKRRWGWMRKK
ncbi:MAG: hypothetical protein V1678_00120 [Candidatus Aenigmatarchaeota archaeon]